MRKAALPIPHIIALIIGIIVVAVLAYWFISSSGKGTNVGSEIECTGRKVEYCTTQTTDVWEKIVERCSGDEFLSNPAKCGEFCNRIIPKWKPAPGTESKCSLPQR